MPFNWAELFANERHVISRHLIDPELAVGLAAFPPFEELSAETLLQMRAMMSELARVQIAETPRDGVTFTQETVPGPSGAPGVRVLLYRPANAHALMPAFLHIHGGGLVLGSPEIRHASSIHISSRFGCLVLSVDYRLAPETQFPGAIEDCYAALSWLHQNASALGVDRTRIVIGGESAGGGIAAALAILARDRGNIPLAYQLLIYPMLDDRTCVTSDHPHVGHFVWTQANNRFGWNSYLGHPPGGEDVGAYSAAARCDDLAGLPPAFLAAGSLDLFLEEDIDYARRLIRAGVPAELHIYPGAFHAFDLIADAGVSKAFRRDWQNALEKAFSR